MANGLIDLNKRLLAQTHLAGSKLSPIVVVEAITNGSNSGAVVTVNLPTQHTSDTNSDSYSSVALVYHSWH